MSGLKQRIIGALVLISLAVIFVPMMFDEPHNERAVRSLDIPEEPPFPEVNAPGDADRLEGVPSYRVEELDPAPVPDVIEDPAMGQEPSVAGDDSASAEAGDPVPLVGEQDPESPPSVRQETRPAEVTDTEVPAEVADSDAGPASGDEASEADADADFQRTLEGAWILQLGSFGNADNARRLRDNVRERGYGAHLQEVTRGDQRLVRVFSGPFAEKAEAEKAESVLDEAFGIKSLVTKGEG